LELTIPKFNETNSVTQDHRHISTRESSVAKVRLTLDKSNDERNTTGTRLVHPHTLVEPMDSATSLMVSRTITTNVWVALSGATRCRGR